jgi:hypothetical protein
MDGTAIPFRVRHSEKCLDVPGNSNNNGVQLQQFQCNATAAQLYFMRHRFGHYYLQKLNSTKCVDVRGAGMTNGTAFQQWDCVTPNPTNQRVWLAQNSISYSLPDFQVVAVHSGKCMDVNGIAMHDQAVIHQWTCNPGASGPANQRWYNY